MSINSNSSDKLNALTPYGLNRRKGPRDDRRQGRERRENQPPYRVRYNRRNAPKNQIECSIDPTEAAATLRGVEQRIQVDPQTARNACRPNREVSGQLLRNEPISKAQAQRTTNET